MVRKKILSRAKKNNFKRKAKGRRVQSKRVSKRVSKKKTKRSSNKKMRGGARNPFKNRSRNRKAAGLNPNAPDPRMVKQVPLQEPKVNEDKFKEIMEDIKIRESSRNKECDWEMEYYKNNIFILIFIYEKTNVIKIETMNSRYDERFQRAPKGLVTRVLYHMIRIAAGNVVRPFYTINVTATTDESNIESLCSYYENMSFEKDPDHPREGGSQRLKTSVKEFLNNRIDDILNELIEIMLSKGIKNATKLINTLVWKEFMQENGNETIYKLLRDLKEEIDDDDDSFSGILSSEDKTKMEDIFSLYLSGI